jgi:serine/threonine protein kinase
MLAGSAAASKSVRDRFQREAEITSKLNHPGICGIYEVGEVEEVPYIAMQYVRRCLPPPGRCRCPPGESDRAAQRSE